MFTFLLSEERKLRRHAAHWLEVATRVHHFRRDQLTDEQNHQLQAAGAGVRQRLQEYADAGRLRLAIEHLEGVLRSVGGRHYPTSSFVENIEFLVVAALVILGLRAYFVQPFKIPTNSMWPTYYGMTQESFKPGEEPGWLARAGRFLAFGAVNYSATAPADGEVFVPVLPTASAEFTVLWSAKATRTLGLFPSQKREYQFLVGGQVVRLLVPLDFDFESVLAEQFGGPDGLGRELAKRLAATGKPPRTSLMTRTIGGQRFEQTVYWVPLGKEVRRGGRILSFDILTGDLLFVDRFSYNFFPPRVGQGFVFKTGNIAALADEEGDKYFIKRLVGVPGDKLEIQPVTEHASDGRVAPGRRGGGGVLLRNGAPITGADAFGANAALEGRYPGYSNYGLLGVGDVAAVPARSYMALGDNSPRSKDSRYWGYVPDKDVVGKPLFIYYPLTKRWGIAK